MRVPVPVRGLLPGILGEGGPQIASVQFFAAGVADDQWVHDVADQLVTSLWIVDGSLLAVGGAVAPSVATVTVNGQPPGTGSTS